MKNNEMMNIIFKTTYKCDNLIFFPLQYLIENITNSQLFFSFYLHERCFGLSCLFPNEHQIENLYKNHINFNKVKHLKINLFKKKNEIQIS